MSTKYKSESKSIDPSYRIGLDPLSILLVETIRTISKEERSAKKNDQERRSHSQDEGWIGFDVHQLAKLLVVWLLPGAVHGRDVDLFLEAVGVCDLQPERFHSLTMLAPRGKAARFPSRSRGVQGSEEDQGRREMCWIERRAGERETKDSQEDEPEVCFRRFSKRVEEERNDGAVAWFDLCPFVQEFLIVVFDTRGSKWQTGPKTSDDQEKDSDRRPLFFHSPHTKQNFDLFPFDPLPFDLLSFDLLPSDLLPSDLLLSDLLPSDLLPFDLLPFDLLPFDLFLFDLLLFDPLSL